MQIHWSILSETDGNAPPRSLKGPKEHEELPLVSSFFFVESWCLCSFVVMLFLCLSAIGHSAVNDDKSGQRKCSCLNFLIQVACLTKSLN